ncbi:MAG: cysteine desulfurase [Verrucomicrobiales bacterium]|nr:cysteine desulfurase [Verrucomicrobiales bacterium]
MNIAAVRSDFPILSREVSGKPLVYLDNGATTQKPCAVIDKISRFFEYENSNIHRGVHYLSMDATDQYDRARLRLAEMIHAPDTNEVIFVRGTTEAINLVANSYGERLQEGDEILLTLMEHHANIVPWQMLAERKGLVIRVAGITETGELDLDDFTAKLSEKTKIAAFTQVSNALGTINPVKELTRLAKEKGAMVLVDGAQAVPHLQVDVQDIGCDFYAFSSHKMFGPDGVGVLWGKQEWLNSMPPYQGGGDMIEQVSFAGTTYRGIPERFEAGTPNISGAIGLGAAVDYLNQIGHAEIERYEKELLDYATAAMSEIEGLNIHGRAENKVGVISFTLDGIHPHDIGTILDTEGVAIRAGHHCAQPLMDHLKISGTARASFAFYNTQEEADTLVAAIRKVQKMFA